MAAAVAELYPAAARPELVGGSCQRPRELDARRLEF
jgi:hypothetical protein